jgi:hypothetical protein
VRQEIPIHRIAAGGRFKLWLDGWGKHYGTRTGTVLYHGMGSTRVRWDGTPETREFVNSQTGNTVSFVSPGSRESYVSLDTPVEAQGE